MSSRKTASKWTKKASVSKNVPAISRRSASDETKKVMHTKGAKKIDRRVRQTRNALGDALVTLIQEQPFDSITIQHVLDRAKVSRSTFYNHFRDKDDLFLSDADEFFELFSTSLQRFGDKSNRVAPVREFFSHVADQRQFLRALIGSQKYRDILELGEGHFSRAIEARLAALPATRSMTHQERAARAHALSGALFSMLTWWINHKTRASPQQMDDLFHQIVWSGIQTQQRPAVAGKPVRGDHG